MTPKQNNMRLKALIIDDEQASRETLKNYLGSYCGELDIMGMAENLDQALQLIKKYKPDVIFLDIEMPFGNGFDLLEQAGEQGFETIFVTAFSEYALRAIKVSASNYLLKPIDIDELIAAVEKVREQHSSKSDHIHTRILIENSALVNRQQHKIVLPSLEGFEVVTIKDVVFCEAEDNFTRFHMVDGSKRLICRTLKFYEELLGDFDFIRIHKSHLINRHFVSRYLKGKGGQVVLSTGETLEVSPTRKSEFLDLFRDGR